MIHQCWQLPILLENSFDVDSNACDPQKLSKYIENPREKIQDKNDAEDKINTQGDRYNRREEDKINTQCDISDREEEKKEMNIFQKNEKSRGSPLKEERFQSITEKKSKCKSINNKRNPPKKIMKFY